MSVDWNDAKIQAMLAAAIHNGLDAAGDVIVNEAVAIHGRDHGGVPSKPFEPPNVQTNNLRASIRRTRAENNYVGIGTAVDYGKYLEYGTLGGRITESKRTSSKGKEFTLRTVAGQILPRPWLRPAFAKARNKALAAFAAGFRIQMQRGAK